MGYTRTVSKGATLQAKVSDIIPAQGLSTRWSGGLLALGLSLGLARAICACGGEQRADVPREVIAQAQGTDCVSIAAKATRCDSAVRRMADKLEELTRARYLSLEVTLGLLAFKSASGCRAHVRRRVAFLKKSCRKLGDAVDLCRRTQRRHVKSLAVLRSCFASEDCETIAACYVGRYAPLSR